VRALASIKHAHTLSMIGEGDVHTLASIKHTRTPKRLPPSKRSTFSQLGLALWLACMFIILKMAVSCDKHSSLIHRRDNDDEK